MPQAVFFSAHKEPVAVKVLIEVIVGKTLLAARVVPNGNRRVLVFVEARKDLDN
jgi:hypothetical protein